MEDAPGLADGFYLIDAFVANARWMNFVSETPVFARYCLDTDTAEVYAEVTSTVLWAVGSPLAAMTSVRLPLALLMRFLQMLPFRVQTLL